MDDQLSRENVERTSAREREMSRMEGRGGAWRGDFGVVNAKFVVIFVYGRCC
jgi:hypothetical protein